MMNLIVGVVKSRFFIMTLLTFSLFRLKQISFGYQRVINRHESIRSTRLLDKIANLQSSNQSERFICLSFYKFFPIPDPNNIVKIGKEVLFDEHVKGTLYIAEEGVNGQLCIPEEYLQRFKLKLASIHPQLETLDINVGTSLVAKTENDLPFKKLIIRPRDKVLRDGLPTNLNWNDGGPELEPSEWHTAITSNRDVILLDCRNDYESQMGTFEGALPLNTSVFSESWDRLQAVLRDAPKDTKILTFCTGGIRCVKVNAYLKQQLGFNNIGRLKNGIIAYEKWAEEAGLVPQGPGMEGEKDGVRQSSTLSAASKGSLPASSSRFLGRNFLFDRRRLALGANDDKAIDALEEKQQQPDDRQPEQQAADSHNT